MKYVNLSNSVAMPQIGFGVGSEWRVQKLSSKMGKDAILPELIEVVQNSITSGFTHLDCAEVYQTRRELEQGIANSGAKRESLFITDKHFPGHSGLVSFTNSPAESLQVALDDLKTEYLDCYLLHNAFNAYPNGVPMPIREQWKHMEESYRNGKAKSIGVSNYSADNLKELLATCEIKPHVVQLEYHAMCQDKSPGILQICRDNGIQVTAYAPLAPLTQEKSDNELKQYVRDLAKQKGCSEAQVYLRWVMDTGVVPLTTSRKKERLAEALAVLDMSLSPAEVEQILALGRKSAKSFYNW